ncbi:MAG: carboxypeptidase-like regulatory domain-containing protein [Actinomycetota bacterium]|nr:carboxypeptidase-like regulatory domain-containing protein [Actinomycetota bacterium]
MNGHGDGDRGAASSTALLWSSALLALIALVAGLGWAGVFSGDGASPVTTAAPIEWPATTPSGADLHECPAGDIVGHLSAGDSVTVVGRAEGNSWLAVLDPGATDTVVWVLAAALLPEGDALAWGSLPRLGCGLAAGDATDFHGRVLDAATGVPVAGVSVTATDEAGDVIDTTIAVSAADGSYALTGLTGEEYGIWVDGSAVGYEQGFTGGTISAIGYLVVPSWGEAATAAPGIIGDIALDSLGTPTTTTSGAATTTTTAPTEVTTTTAVPLGGQPPTIVSVAANPNQVAAFALCGPRQSTLSVVVTDDDSVASVTVEWSYPAVAVVGGPASTAAGTAHLVRVPGSDTWQGSISVWMQPVESPQAFIAMKVTAVDNDNLQWWRNFNRTLSVKHC